MNATELQKQLEELKLENKKKEAELRKQIAKKKRQEDDAFTRAVGKLARASFKDLKTLEAFEQFFANIDK